MNAQLKPESEILPEVVMPHCPELQLLKGQKALVTGANSGIGRAIAIELAKAGAAVVVNYYADDEAAQGVVDEILSCGCPKLRAYAHRADVSKEEEVQGMFRRMIEEFGTIDILVNNAGLQVDAPFHEMTLSQWHRVLEVNLTGQFLCARGYWTHHLMEAWGSDRFTILESCHSMQLYLRPQSLPEKPGYRQ